MINILKHIEELKPFLLEMIDDYGNLAMVNGAFCKCFEGIKCSDCYFYQDDGECVENTLNWLLSDEEEVEDEKINEKS